MRSLALLLIAFAASSCGILGISVACNDDDNCIEGVCVDGTCTTDPPDDGDEGEGEEGEGEEGEGEEGEGEGDGGEGEGEEGEGEEGEGEEGEGEGEEVPNACALSVFVPPEVDPEAVVAKDATPSAVCFTSLTAAFNAGASNIYLAPGVYDETTETFPLTPPEGTLLVGDVGVRGVNTRITTVVPIETNETMIALSGAFTMLGVQLGEAGDESSRLLDVFGGDVLIEDCTFEGTDTMIRAVGWSDTLQITRTTLLNDVAFSIADGVFANLSGGTVSVNESSFRGMGITVFGGGAVGGLTLTDVEFEVGQNVDLRAEAAAAFELTRVAFTMHPDANSCQGGANLILGDMKIRDSTFTGLICDPGGAVDERGAVDVTANVADNTPLSLDLGTAADPGGNTFTGNLVDLSVRMSTAGRGITVPAFGNDWTNADNACVEMRLEEGAQQVFVDTDDGQCVPP